ncbi:multidrug effflux MFS transporter [Roseomonas elaeocarpi]|uniref:Bcr/CflA family efflux transporter n=1 Tax=Roseomonas elaeocarpi TaxID=907779 RepID=A0ABV6JR03_9PROT
MPSWLPILLGFLTAIGPISTDMYLPAFPAIEASFGTETGTAQITLATWFVGLAVGQITQGTLADRFGRRGPLLVGTLIYTAGSIGCALAPDLGTLAAFRCVAAFGGSASMVIPRAIVRDVSEGLGATRLMSRLMLVSGVAPILAPSLGGLLLGVADWRAIFWVAALYGVVSCVIVWWKLPDTLATQNRVSLGVVSLLTRYADILRDPTFLTHMLMGGFMMFLMFAYLGGAPGVFIEVFQVSPQIFGALFGVNAVGFIGMSQLNPYLVGRFGGGKVISWGSRVSAVAVLVLLFVSITGPFGLLSVFVPIFVAVASSSLVLPNSAVGALARQAMRAGSASALMGTLQFALAASASLVVGLLSDGTVRPLAITMLIGVVGALVADLFRRRALRRLAVTG